jgi:hypothetical protein
MKIRKGIIIFKVRARCFASLPAALGAMLLCSAGHGEPGNWRIVPSIGYATVDLKAVNSNADNYAGAMESFTRDYMNVPDGTGLSRYVSSVNYSVEKADKGVSYGIDVGYRAFEGGGLGFRIGYLKPADIKVSGHGSGAKPVRTWQMDPGDGVWKWMITGWVPGGVEFSDEVVESSVVLSLLSGGWIEGGDPDGLNYSGFVYAGPSIAWDTTKQRQSVSDSYLGLSHSADYTSEASGMQAGMEAGGRLGLGLNGYASLFAEFSFRYQEIAYMRQSKDVDVDGDGVTDLKKGVRINGTNDAPLIFNYSGVSFKTGVDIRF